MLSDPTNTGPGENARPIGKLPGSGDVARGTITGDAGARIPTGGANGGYTTLGTLAGEVDPQDIALSGQPFL